MRYDAFISYSHEADGMLAPALQEGLRKLARPWNRRQALRVFRDDTGLSVTAALWPAIENALRDSEYFILLASPKAASSEWVNREIEFWLANRDRTHLLPVVTSGEWIWSPETGDLDFLRSTAVPSALAGAFSSQPRHLDFRWAVDAKSLQLRNTRFRDAVADLASTIHGVPKDELETEDLRQYRKIVRLRRAAITALVTLALAATVGGGMAFFSRQEATRQRDEAERRGRLALARQLETESRAALDAAKPEHALLLALQSLEATRIDGIFLPPAETWLYQAIARLPSRPLRLWSLELSPALSGDDAAALPFALAFAPDGRTLSVGGAGSSVQSFPIRLDMHETLDFLIEHGEPLSERPETVTVGPPGARSVLALRFSPDGRWLAIASVGGGLQLVSVGARQNPPQRLAASEGVIATIDFAPNSRSLVTGDDRGRVYLIDLGKPQAAPRLLAEHKDVVTGAVFSPDGLWVASASVDGAVKLRAVEDSGTEARTLRDAGKPAHALAVSGDGRWLAIGGTAGVEIRSGNDYGVVSRTLVADEVITSVALSRDGRRLAAGDRDGSLRLWDLQNMGSDVRELAGHGRLISSLAFSPDGNWLASSSYDGTVRLWPLDIENILRVFCQIVPDKLSADALRSALTTAARTDLRGSDLIADACREPLRYLADNRTRLVSISGFEDIDAAITVLEQAWTRTKPTQP